MVTANLAAFVLERDARDPPAPEQQHAEVVELLQHIVERLDALERRQQQDN